MAQVFEEFKARIQKFQRDVEKHSLKCFVSSSVVKESEDKLDEVINFVGKTLSELIVFFQARSLSTRVPFDKLELKRDDVLVFERFFMDKFRQITAAGRKDGFVRRLREVEVAVIQSFEEKIAGKESIPLGVLMQEIVAEVIQVSDVLKSKYRHVMSNHECIDITPDSDLLKEARDLGLASPGDADHVASAATYARREGIKVIFVSFDYKDIVSRSHEIERKLGVRCSDPLYAVYHCILDS